MVRLKQLFRPLLNWSRRVVQSFWLIPLVFMAAGGVCAMLVIYLDGSELARRWRETDALLHITAEGGRSLVSTVAGGIFTVASLVFSLTFVALTLMSQQLGPRLIQIFARDTFAKVCFGIFTAAFLFCLVVLSVIGTGPKGDFVPIVSLMLAMVVAIVCFCVMIMYINYIAESIQADTLIARLGDQLRTAFRQTTENSEFSGRNGDGEDEDSDADVRELCNSVEEKEYSIHAGKAGYVASIDSTALGELFSEHDLRGLARCRQGDFLTAETVIVSLDAPISGEDSDEIEAEIRDVFTIEQTRAQSETGEFESHALVEVALRALSPGVNDPYTAIACIDQLTTGLALLVEHKHWPRTVCDSSGKIRLVLHDSNVSHLINVALHPLRHAARDAPAVLKRLIEAVRLLGNLASDTPEIAKLLLEHVDAIDQTIDDGLATQSDRAYLKSRLEVVREELRDG